MSFWDCIIAIFLLSHERISVRTTLENGSGSRLPPRRLLHKSSSLEEVKAKIARINEFIRSLRFPVQESKVEYGQSLTFLGIVYDTLSMTTRVDPSAAIGTLHVIQHHIMPHLHKRGKHWTTDPLSTYQGPMET
jgi:hypothetical protein